MKRTLFFSLVLFVGLMNITAQTKTVWNFSTEPFISQTPVGGGVFHSNVTYVTEDGLTFQTDGRYGWGLKADDKVQPEFDGVTYTHSITTTGGVSLAPGHYTLPYGGRYISFDVAGDSEIQVLARSYNSTPAGKIVITDHEETFVDTIGRPTQGAARWYTFSYFGGPTRLYIYPPKWINGNCGVNFYAITATNVVPVEGEKTSWDFSDAEFSSMNYEGVFNNKQTYTTENLLSVVGNGSYGWTYRAPDNRVASFNFKGTLYTNTMEIAGGVSLTSDHRYFSFPVKGNSLIEIGARSYNATPMGKVIITDAENTFVDTVITHNQQVYPTTHSYVYQGAATTLKLIPIKWTTGNNGSNFYFITATNVGEAGMGVADVKNLKHVTYNQKEIINSVNQVLEVYAVSGQLLFRSDAAVINVQHLNPGVYVIRERKSGGSMKILK